MADPSADALGRGTDGASSALNDVDRDPLAERVAFVARDTAAALGCIAEGFVPDPAREAFDGLSAHVSFDARRSLETDPTRKQLIPYVVVTDGSRVLVLRRKRAQTEARLHDKLSIGVGGHVPDELEGAADLLHAGMMRELEEELWLPAAHALRYRGTLNDDSTEVGAVHLGLVYTCRVDASQTRVREVDKMVGEWWTLDELAAHRSRLETWSDLIFGRLAGWLGPAEAQP